MPTALITGVTGQDGSYLAEFLLEQGYQVVGMVRRTSTINFDRIQHIQDQIEIVQGDLLDQMSLIGILQEYNPAKKCIILQRKVLCRPASHNRCSPASSRRWA